MAAAGRFGLLHTKAGASAPRSRLYVCESGFCMVHVGRGCVKVGDQRGRLTTIRSRCCGMVVAALCGCGRWRCIALAACITRRRRQHPCQSLSSHPTNPASDDAPRCLSKVRVARASTVTIRFDHPNPCPHHDSESESRARQPLAQSGLPRNNCSASNLIPREPMACVQRYALQRRIFRSRTW